MSAAVRDALAAGHRPAPFGAVRSFKKGICLRSLIFGCLIGQYGNASPESHVEPRAR